MDSKNSLFEDLEDLDLEDDYEINDIRQLDPNTLIKDEQDLYMLNNLSELERETIFAKRKQKIEKVRERIEVRRMIKRRMESLRVGQFELPKGSRPYEHDLRGYPLMASHERRDYPSQRQEFEQIKPPGTTTYHKVRKTAPPPSFNQVQSLQVTRSEISEWVFAPFFDRTLKGCFLRFCIESGGTNKPPLYKVVQVLDVQNSREPYNIGGSMVDKCALLKIGSIESVQNFDIVSNYPITQHEYRQWLVDVEASGTGYITQEFIQKKTSDLTCAREHTWSNDELNYRLEKKRALELVPKNIPSQIVQLRNMYQQVVDSSIKEEIKKRLDRLIGIMKGKRTNDKHPQSGTTQKPPKVVSHQSPNHNVHKSTFQAASRKLPPTTRQPPEQKPSGPRQESILLSKKTTLPLSGIPAPKKFSNVQTVAPYTLPSLLSCIELSNSIDTDGIEFKKLTQH